MLRIIILSFFVFSSACQKERAKESPPDTEVVASHDRGEVVGTLQLPAGDSLQELAPLIDQVQPGGAVMLGTQIPMLLAKACGVDLSGADLSKPVAVLILNPKKFRDPMAVLVHASDPKALQTAASAGQRGIVLSEGLALIGAADVVTSAQGYAFGALASPTKQVVAVAYPLALNTIYKQELNESLDQISSAMEQAGSQAESMVVLLRLYKNAMDSLALQSDRVEVTFDTKSQTPGLLFKIFPIGGTTMAAFVKAQVPAQHQLLSKLPASSEDSIVFSGVFRAGGAQKAIVDFGVEAMKTMYQKDGLGKLGELLGPWIAAFDGRVAMTMSMNLDASQGGSVPRIRYLLGSSDSKAMRKGWHEMFELLAAQSDGTSGLKMMGMTSKIEVNKNVLQVGGVEVDHYHSMLDVESMPAEQRIAFAKTGAADQNMYFAAFDEYAAMTSEVDGKRSISSMVMAARGKEEGFQPSASLASVLEGSKARKESLVMYMETGSLLPANTAAAVPFKSIIMGIGKDKDALVMRIAVGL